MHDLESAIYVTPRWIFAMPGRGTPAPAPDAEASALVRQVRRRGEVARRRATRWILGFGLALVVPFGLGVVASWPLANKAAAAMSARPTRAQITQQNLRRYALVSYPAWSVEHPDRECPRSVVELNRDLHTDRVLDAWGHRIELRCGHGMWLRSAGSDGWFGTADDLVVHAAR
jgi:hypothetical protein